MRPPRRRGNECHLTTRWSGPWTIVGRTLVANRLLAGSACGKRHRGRPLNAIVSHHLESGRVSSIASSSTALEYPVATVGDHLPALNRLRCSVCAASSSPSRGLVVNRNAMHRRPTLVRGQFTQRVGRVKLLASGLAVGQVADLNGLEGRVAYRGPPPPARVASIPAAVDGRSTRS